MSFPSLESLGRDALAAAAGFGFDQLTITAQRHRLLGVRLAQSAVCRENVWREELTLFVQGLWQGRRSSFTTQTRDLNELTRAVETLRRDIERQSPDKESVLPQPPRGRFTWDVAGGELLALYGPEVLYPLVEKHVARVRDAGLRVTGYLEAQETLATTFASSGFELTRRDVGMTVSLTVDDEKTGVVGTTQRAIRGGRREDVDALIADAMDEAWTLCRTSAGDKDHGIGALEPGDYTVVLHPAATLDLVWTTVFYGFFDRRKVDEGRTYLSGKLDEVSFPPGLSLSQTLSLPLPGDDRFCDSPFNHRLMPCESLTLIGDGRVRDLHRSAYWAQKLGLPETFAATDAPPLLLEAKAGSQLAGRHRTTADLIRDTPRGIYVANTWYLRMVAEMDGVITGMTRDGIYEIRDGKLIRPIRHMRWHENPLRVLGAISGLTDDKMLLGGSRLAGKSRTPLAAMPGIRVDNFHFSSVTKF